VDAACAVGDIDDERTWFHVQRGGQRLAGIETGVRQSE
jgi:hypothetical protein